MSYAYKTNKYLLESPSFGEIMQTQSEQRNSQIIDNNIFGAARMHSGGHGIIRVGVFTFNNSGGSGNYIASLGESKALSKPVIEAYIAQVFVYSVNGINWTGLANSTTYYLGVRLVENSTNSSLQNKEVVSWINTTGDVPSDGLLLASLSIDGAGVGTFNTSPTNQINIPVLGNHINTNTNPHGILLNQTNIVTSGLNVLGLLTYNNLQINTLTISGNNSFISGNVTIAGNLIVSGNLTVSGTVNYGRLSVQNLTVPSNLTVGSLTVASGADFYSSSLFRSNVRLSSGVSINGFDPSLGVALVDGSNADNLHTHNFGAVVPIKVMSMYPEYHSTIISGAVVSGVFNSKRSFNSNYYEWNSNACSGSIVLVTNFNLPPDFGKLDRVDLRNYVKKEGILSGANVSVQIFDKDLTQIARQQFQNTSPTLSSITTSGGNNVSNNSLTIMTRLWAASGVAANIGDLNLWYVPKGGEKIVYTWSNAASGNNTITPNQKFNGLRYNPFDIKVDNVVVSSSIALSGNSVSSIKINSVNNTIPAVLPSSAFIRANVLNFGSVGASYQYDNLPVTNPFIISGNTFIQCSLDLVASGSRDLTVQLFGYRA